jgi:hypothetical protein
MVLLLGLVHEAEERTAWYRLTKVLRMLLETVDVEASACATESPINWNVE